MPNAVLTRAIDALAQRRDLSADETAEVLNEIMLGQASEIEIAGFLIALRTKGETVDEIVGLARTMRALAARVETSRADLLDTAGTGGGRSTFNVSTTAALIAAGAGCAVAKHGNRSATSRSGSADVLEALGARIDLDPAGVAACIEEAGFGFMFAPAHHQATRYVIPVRRELAVRTIFNLLGPLTNPAGASRQVIGVSDPGFAETIAGALARLGVARALVLASEDGLDEVSICAATTIVEVNGEDLRRYTLTPAEVGIETISEADFAQACAGGAPQDNAAMTRAVLEDGESSAARRQARRRASISPRSTPARRYMPPARRRRLPRASRLHAARSPTAPGRLRWRVMWRRAVRTPRRRWGDERSPGNGARAHHQRNTRRGSATQAGRAG